MAAKNFARLALPLVGFVMCAGVASAQSYGYDHDAYAAGHTSRYGYERGSYEVRAYEGDGRGWRETYSDGDAWHSDYGYDDEAPAHYAPAPVRYDYDDRYDHGPSGGEITLSNGFFHGGLTGGVGPSWGAGWRYGDGGRGVVIVHSSASASASAYAYASARSSISVRGGGGKGCCR